jgi:hypothetical protein
LRSLSFLKDNPDQSNALMDALIELGVKTAEDAIERNLGAKWWQNVNDRKKEHENEFDVFLMCFSRV